MINGPRDLAPLHNAVDAALDDVPARRHIQSMIVVRGGEVELERYFRDRRPTDLSNVHSVTHRDGADAVVRGKKRRSPSRSVKPLA